MTEERESLLIELEVRIKQMIDRCDSYAKENLHLNKELENAKSLLKNSQTELHELETKYSNLKIARTITAASVDVENAKIKLSKMVREVDKCINLLKG